jgi:hypothetical protein
MRAGTQIVLLIVAILAGTGNAYAEFDDYSELPGFAQHAFGHRGGQWSGPAVFVLGREWTYRYGNFYVGSDARQTPNDPFAQAPQSQHKVNAATDASEPIRVDRKVLFGRIHDIQGEVEKLTEQIKEVEDAVNRYSCKFSQVNKMDLDQIDDFLKGKTDTLNGYDAEAPI